MRRRSVKEVEEEEEEERRKGKYLQMGEKVRKGRERKGRDEGKEVPRSWREGSSTCDSPRRYF